MPFYYFERCLAIEPSVVPEVFRACYACGAPARFIVCGRTTREFSEPVERLSHDVRRVVEILRLAFDSNVELAVCEYHRHGVRVK